MSPAYAKLYDTHFFAGTVSGTRGPVTRKSGDESFSAIDLQLVNVSTISADIEPMSP